MPSWERLEECNRENIKCLGGRFHSKVKGRFITVLIHKDKLFCIDSCCFHASGPLGDGPVMDIEDIPTIRCLWHNFIVSLETGERITQEVLLPGEEQGNEHQPVSMSFPLRPRGTTGKAKKHGEPVQRVHNVREVEYEGVERDRWPVEVELLENTQYEKEPVRSDIVACNQQYAKMCIVNQQRRIDNNQLNFKEGAGEENQQQEIQMSFVQSLLHAAQTSKVFDGEEEGENNNNNSNSNSSSSSSSSSSMNELRKNSNSSSPTSTTSSASANASTTSSVSVSALIIDSPTSASDSSSPGTKSPPQVNSASPDAEQDHLPPPSSGGNTTRSPSAEEQRPNSQNSFASATAASGGDDDNNNNNVATQLGFEGSPRGPPGNPRAPTPPPSE